MSHCADAIGPNFLEDTGLQYVLEVSYPILNVQCTRVDFILHLSLQSTCVFIFSSDTWKKEEKTQWKRLTGNRS